MEKKTLFRAYLATTVSHTFWGFSYMASRVALDRSPVFVLLSHRFLLSFLAMNLLLLFRMARLEIRGKRALLLVVLGLAEPVVYYFGEQYGLLHSSTIFSGVIIAMIPIVSTLLAVPFLREIPTRGQMAFSLLSVGGVVGIGLLTRSSGHLDWIGVTGLLVAVLSASAYTLLGRGISGEFSAFTRTYVMIAVGAVVFTAAALVDTHGSLVQYVQPLRDGGYVLSMAFLAICCSCASYFFSAFAISHLPVARETVFANLTTAVSVFAGAVFLREPFSWLGLLFCLLIVFGIWGVQQTGRT